MEEAKEVEDEEEEEEEVEVVEEVEKVEAEVVLEKANFPCDTGITDFSVCHWKFRRRRTRKKSHY